MNPYDLIISKNQMPQRLAKEMKQNQSIDYSSVKEHKKSNIDSYIDNRLRSDKPITFLGFVNDLKALWEAAGNKAKIVRYKPQHDPATFPIVTYRMLKRVINPHIKDLKPRHRETIRHPYRQGEFIDLFGQSFDLLVEFTIHSTSAEEADEIVVEFEDFLLMYSGYFKSRGVQEILFHEQGEDEVAKESRVDINKRKIKYIMRFEKISVLYTNEIKEIAVQANIHHEDEDN